MRLLFISSEPRLSDDVWRYAWDGTLLSNGINPYAFSPAAEELKELRKPWHNRITYPDRRTSYPPMGVAITALGHNVSLGFLGQKILFFLMELLGFLSLVFFLFRLNEKEKLQRLILFYWLNPLVIVLASWEAHLDISLIFFFSFLAMIFFHSRWYDESKKKVDLKIMGVVLISLIVLVKPYFAVLFFLYVSKKAWPYLMIAILVGLLFIFPFRKDIWQLLESPITYANHWEFNSLYYNTLKLFFIEPIARGTSYGSAIVVSILIVLFADKKISKLLSIPIILLPTVYPWYLVPAIFFAALEKENFVILLSCTLPLSYLSWQFAKWQLPFNILLIEYLIPFLVLFFKKPKLKPKISI